MKMGFRKIVQILNILCKSESNKSFRHTSMFTELFKTDRRKGEATILSLKITLRLPFRIGVSILVI